MTTVTNGTVEFERVQRPADFESKRVRVTLSYAVADGEDPAAVAAQVGDMAHAEVFRMLARKEAAVDAKPVKPPKIEAVAPQQQQQEPALAAPTAEPEAASEPENTASEVPNPTDIELQAACQRARARGCTPEQVKELIASMVPQPGMRIIHLPDPRQRAAALAAVDALKAGGAADY